MGLTRPAALERCRALVANARRLGGALVVNWHERSLAPERLWGAAYDELLAEIESSDRVWFATAGEAVDWFRWRRAIAFSYIDDRNGGGVRVSAPPASRPGILRIHRPGADGPCLQDRVLDGDPALDVHV
jgi:hypothetical protein